MFSFLRGFRPSEFGHHQERGGSRTGLLRRRRHLTLREPGGSGQRCQVCGLAMLKSHRFLGSSPGVSSRGSMLQHFFSTHIEGCNILYMNGFQVIGTQDQLNLLVREWDIVGFVLTCIEDTMKMVRCKQTITLHHHRPQIA